MALSSNQKSIRAVVRALDPLTDFVTITKDDPGDQNDRPDAFLFDPDNLFLLEFRQLAIEDDALVRGFKTALKKQLPQLRADIEGLAITPKVPVGLVQRAVSRMLDIKAGGSQ